MTTINLTEKHYLEIERCQDPFLRQSLLDQILPIQPYIPRSIQDGSAFQIDTCLQNINKIIAAINVRCQDLRYFWEGVVLDSQQIVSVTDFENLQGTDLLANLPSHHVGGKVYQCRTSRSQFITKQFHHGNWRSCEMQLPLICKNNAIIQPLGLIFNYQNLYILLPEITGRTVTEFIKRRNTVLSPEECDYLFYKYLECLRDMDNLGLLHRNIQPCHMMISRNTQSSFLVGYGSICRQEDAASTLTDSAQNNFYCAPEVARGEAHTSKSDLYSLGCSIVSCITGDIPFFGIPRTQRNDYRHRIGTGEINPFNTLRRIEEFTLNNASKRRLLEIIKGITRHDPIRRPTAEEVIVNYYSVNQVPQWDHSFFATRTMNPVFDPPQIPIPDLNAVAVLPQNGIYNIPSSEILESAREVEAVAVPAAVPVVKPPVSMHDADSGRQTREDVWTINMWISFKRTDIHFGVESTSHGADIYRKVKNMLKVGGFELVDEEERILQFETSLEEFHQRGLKFYLVEVSREAEESEEPQVQMGAAYNGEDHVYM